MIDTELKEKLEQRLKGLDINIKDLTFNSFYAEIKRKYTNKYKKFYQKKFDCVFNESVTYQFSVCRIESIFEEDYCGGEKWDCIIWNDYRDLVNTYLTVPYKRRFLNETYPILEIIIESLIQAMIIDENENEVILDIGTAYNE